MKLLMSRVLGFGLKRTLDEDNSTVVGVSTSRGYSVEERWSSNSFGKSGRATEVVKPF